MMQSSNPNPNNDEAQQPPQLTSTTAPGKVFESRAALAQHYKSQWHTYNLKRREAGLPPLLEHEFEARLQAAQEALQAQQAPSHQTAHLKNKTNKKHKKQQQSKNKKQSNSSGGGVLTVSQSPAYDRIKQQQQQQEEETEQQVEAGESTKKEEEEEEESDPQQSTSPQPASNPETLSTTNNMSSTMEQQVQTARETLDIDPRRCLFDRHVSANVQANVHRMQQKYGFFVPDAEYLVDVQGLIGYCHEKIHVGRVCLYCQKTFGSGQACVTHMRSTRHTKLRYEAGVDLEEFDVFYDFGDANREFLMGHGQQQQQKGEAGEEEELAMEEADGKVNDDIDDDIDEDDEWEDMSDEGEMELQNDDDADDEEDDNDDIYAGYEQEVAAMGLDVTPLGELVFPDGRIVGHRAFRRYYKQRAPRQPDDRASVQAARLAAGDRLYQGRVVNIYSSETALTTTTTDNATAAAARQAGLKPSQLHGAVGKGVLVASRGDAATNNPAYTQVSIYRYRAALRKQRRGEAKGQQLHQRTNMNVNRMDKKHNRLMNGVSVAHAAR